MKRHPRIQINQGLWEKAPHSHAGDAGAQKKLLHQHRPA
jgi:hypothetical protein